MARYSTRASGDGGKVLQKYRVLRLGQSVSGDFLCQLLTNAGAKVDCLSEAQHDISYDVVINDLGRGANIPAGFSFAEMSEAGPSLVYCALVSFPADGPTDLPELEDAPILATMGLNRMSPGTVVHERLRIPSFYGAVMAAIYIVCGLMPRNRTAEAKYMEVSLFAAAMNILGRRMIQFENEELRDPQTVNLMLPVSKVRKCADGRYLQPQGRYPNLVRILFEAAGRPEWADAAADSLEYLPDRAALKLWNDRMDAMFLGRPAAEWEQIINDAGGASTLIRSHEEWVAEAQPHRSGIFVEGKTGKTEAGPGCVVTEGPECTPSLSDVSTPIAGEAPRRPLSGIRVLDFTIIIAGPTMGRILADLGADVIRVDSPYRVVNPIIWMDVNRGKRSIVLAMDKPEARSIARALARKTDVILENFRTGKMERLGLGYTDVIRDNPGVIYTSGNLFDQTGPWADRPGWDHNAQAATGMSWARAVDGVPNVLGLPVNDCGTGLLGAFGTVLGLLHRQLAGRGCRVAVSLARTASILQQKELTGSTEIGSSRVRQETIACQGGWVTAYLQPGEDLPADCLEQAPDMTPEDLRAFLSRLGVSSAAENRTADLVSSDLLDRTGIRTSWEHPEFGPFKGVVPAGIMSGFVLSPRECAPVPGRDNAQVLSELGLEAELHRYEADGVVGSFSLFGQTNPEKENTRPARLKA